MMISTKGRYALRIMIDLAQHDSDVPVSVREIALRQEISGKYMEQIIGVRISIIAVGPDRDQTIFRGWSSR